MPEDLTLHQAARLAAEMKNPKDLMIRLRTDEDEADSFRGDAADRVVSTLAGLADASGMNTVVLRLTGNEGAPCPRLPEHLLRSGRRLLVFVSLLMRSAPQSEEILAKFRLKRRIGGISFPESASVWFIRECADRECDPICDLHLLQPAPAAA